MSTALPLKHTRLVLLTLTWALAVVGGSVALNAVVKRNQQVARVKHEVAAQHVTLSVDTFDLLRSGIVLAAGCVLLTLASSLWQFLLFRDIRNKEQSSSVQPLSTRTLRYQWISLGFLSIWILACEIAVTKIAVTSGAKTTAYLDGQQLPEAAVEATQTQLGVNPAYWAQGYVRLQVIPPWVAFGLAAVTTVVSFIAWKRAAAIDSSKRSFVGSEGAPGSVIDKPTMTEREHV